MKKLLLIAICLLIPAAAWGWFSIRVAGGPVVASSPAGCTTPADGNVLSEGFLETGYETAGWTESGSGTIDEDHTLVGAWPTDVCSEGLLVSGSASSSSAVFNSGASYDPASTALDFTYFFKINSHTMAEGDSIYIYGWSTDDGSPLGGPFSVQIRIDTSAFQLCLLPTYNCTNISDDVVYRLILHLDTTAANSTYDLDSWNGSTYADVTAGSFTRGSGSGQYLHAGIMAVGAAEAGEIEIGGVWIDTP